jgi:hypothetical protein
MVFQKEKQSHWFRSEKGKEMFCYIQFQGMTCERRSQEICKLDFKRCGQFVVAEERFRIWIGEEKLFIV